MNKKGDLVWDNLGKAILTIIALLIIFMIIWLLKDKIDSLITKFKFIFGG